MPYASSASPIGFISTEGFSPDTRLSLGGDIGGHGTFNDPMPQGLEYLRMSSATHALAALLKRLPHGKEAKLTRLDLGASSPQDSHREQRSEIIRLLQESFPAVSQVNIFALYAKHVLADWHATPGQACHASAVRPDRDALGGILVDVARIFPSVRTLAIFAASGEYAFRDHTLSYQDITRLVQGIDGLRHVDLAVFPHGKAYHRSGNDNFELLPTRVDDSIAISVEYRTHDRP